MAEIKGSRLLSCMKAAGISQSELARRTGLSQPSIGRLITGETKETGKLIEIAQALGTTPQYLTGADAPPPSTVESARRGFAGFESAPRREFGDDVMEVREIDLAFGMGGQYLDVQAVQESTVLFPAAWVRQYTKSDPSSLRFCKGDGDSMMPTIGHHDIVLFDLSQNQLNRQDAIWVVALADIGMIKRVRAMPDGSYQIISDNPLIEPQLAVDGELHIIGRVVATIRGH